MHSLQQFRNIRLSYCLSLSLPLSLFRSLSLSLLVLFSVAERFIQTRQMMLNAYNHVLIENSEPVLWSSFWSRNWWVAPFSIPVFTFVWYDIMSSVWSCSEPACSITTQLAILKWDLCGLIWQDCDESPNNPTILWSIRYQPKDKFPAD